MGLTSIEWTGRTWNPIKARTKVALIVPTKADPFRVIPAGTVGYHCERISGGCKACYACTMNGRTLPAWGTGLDYTVPNRDKVDIFLDEKVLAAPERWKSAKVFPGSMTDLFAEFVSDEMLDRMFAVAGLCDGGKRYSSKGNHFAPNHTMQFLTKRADRMARYCLSRTEEWARSAEAIQINKKELASAIWVVRGIRRSQLGFSAEDQPNFDARWEHMRKLAAAGWFVWCSYEPALGPVDASRALREGLRWMVIGGESGPDARPFEMGWAWDTIRQFAVAGVPLFVKQLGSQPQTRTRTDYNWPAGAKFQIASINEPQIFPRQNVKLKNRKGGDPAEWPKWARVRQFPAPTTTAHPELSTASTRKAKA